ncbi:hypothetical protein SAMN05660733_00624 [Lentzea albidocapillata]|uniref:Uncharacterized protein n=1 Tax=Lentzea albidocapillata TaxID=40571 RepID=A0A1W2AEU4_9PSEU|nr:hypothetical protein SAMN05660733_00624 [Lentzea albidocapillata]
MWRSALSATPHGAVFLFHRRPRKGEPLPSDISSTGIARVASGCDSTSRKDVLGRIEIPVVPGAATRTRPVPGRERQFSEQIPAHRTGLAGRVPTVDHDQRAARSFTLVLKLAPELTPAGIGDGPREATVANHARDVEVLDHDQVSRPHKPGAGPVQEVLPSVAHLAMSTSDLGFRLAAITAAAQATCQPPLIASQILRLADQVPRIRDPLPLTGHREIRQTEVDGDVLARGLSRSGSIGVDSKRHVPATVRLTRDHNGCRIQPLEIPVIERPHEPQRRPGLGQYQRPVTQPERRSRVVRALTTRAGLEPGVARASSEEVPKGGVLVSQCLLQRHRGHLRQERELLGALPRGQCCIGFPVRRVHPIGAVAITAVAQRLVPHQTDTSEGAGQHRSLVQRRVGPAPVRHTHDTHSTWEGTRTVTPDCRTEHRRTARRSW